MKSFRNILLLLLSLACLGMTLYALLQGGDPDMSLEKAPVQAADSLGTAWAYTRDSLGLK